MPARRFFSRTDRRASRWAHNGAYKQKNFRWRSAKPLRNHRPNLLNHDGSAMDFAISRARSMNKRTAGLRVRLRNVTIATEYGGTASLIGSSLSELRLPRTCSTERGNAVMNLPLLTRLMRT